MHAVPEEGITSPGVVVMDGCELPGPSEEQPMLLTSEPPLQPPARLFKDINITKLYGNV